MEKELVRKERLRREDLERLQALRPIDDEFMRCIFKDNLPLTQKVLRILLNKPDLNVIKAETQFDMKRLLGARSICLDVFGEDEDGKCYDIEVQRDEKGANPRRARYHSSAMDIENLNAGEEFDNLPDTYVIFITETDIFNKGLPFYSVERVNVELGEMFNDGEHILYVNGAYRGNDDIGKLMHDFSCSDPDDMMDSEIADVTRYYKEKKGVSNMSKVFDELREETELYKARKIALKLIRLEEDSFEKIADVTELPIEEVKRLAENNR